MKSLFFLRDDVTFLNHGSFGASPLPVMREYQRLQIELEKQPVEFMDRRHDAMLSDARNCLANYLGCQAEDLVYVPNTTTGVNAVARSLPLKPGDEVLISDQEYGALEKMWNFVCQTTGAKLVKAVIPFPLSSSEEIKNAILNAVTPKTKVVFFSHISSATALVFPVKEILDALRGSGVYTIIDGAHAPAQIPLNIAELDPGFYTGNCHKWMMAPKGTAFLYAREEFQHLLVPPVISWGNTHRPEGYSYFIDEFEYQGTRDISNFLAVPAAIKFMDFHNWSKVSDDCSVKVLAAKKRMEAIPGMTSLYPGETTLIRQMASVKLPANTPADLKAQLYDQFKIEIPVFPHNGERFIRISLNGYNSDRDVDILIGALEKLIPKETK